jgi:hypothetical protein
MSEGSGQAQKYCGSCGAEVRQSTNFCVSCGTPVNGGHAGPGPDNPVPPLIPPKSLADTVLETFSGLTRLFSNSRSSSGETTMRELVNRGIKWFKDLSPVPRLIIVGLLLVLLLTVLSPVARVVAVIVFVVSAVVLIVRAVQRRPLGGWVTAAVGSVILIPVLGGFPSTLFDSSGPYDPSGTVEEEIRADIQRLSNDGEHGYFKYIIVESEFEHEDRYVLRSQILDEYGYYCESGSSYYNDKFEGDVYNYFYDCYQESVPN